ncbi:MAG: Cof-type HAD-IIB family hydrolase [Erysipelotrichaceae bacterium]|nr:Cof-type HAD-IIB family hydrolase [Erysipelotrichaceae bacterium]
MIKAVFFDIDGTLLSHRTNSVSVKTLQALNELRAQGIKVIICTGRHHLEMEELGLYAIPADGYILLNGQIVMNEAHELIASRPFHGEARDTMIRLFNEKKIPIVIMEEKRMYINCVTDFVREAQAAVHTSVAPVGEYTGNEFYMCMGYFNEYPDTVIPGVQRASWYEWADDLIPDDVSKAAGMEAWMSHYGISRSDTMAFGDGDNDAEMIAFAGTGIAMGNATDRVKACADYITADIDEDGIHQALVHFGLLSV